MVKDGWIPAGYTMSEYRQQPTADDDLWLEWQALIARRTTHPGSDDALGRAVRPAAFGQVVRLIGREDAG